MKRGVAYEVPVETPEQVRVYNDLHTRGAAYWGQRWLKVNQWVLLGAHTTWGFVGMDGDAALRLVYTSIAWRMCVQLFGIPGKFEGCAKVRGELRTFTPAEAESSETLL